MAIEIALTKMLPKGSAPWVSVGFFYFPTCLALLVGMVLPIPPFMKPKWYREQQARSKAGKRTKRQRSR